MRLDEVGWLLLSQAAFADESMTGSGSMQHCSEQDWILAANELLCTVEPSVLRQVCARDGNLPDLYHSNFVVKKILDKYKKRRDSHASIYIRCLTVEGSQNKRLTVDQAEFLAGHALHYARQDPNHAKDVCKIDRVFPDKTQEWQRAWSDNGERHYLCTGKNAIDPSRKHRLLTFARVLTKNVQDCRIRDDRHVPMMHYIDYAVKASVCQKQHNAKGESTNWLCVFALTVLTAMGANPEMHNYTVCLINEEWDGAIGEMLLTRLARAYYFVGGFSIAQAGASMASIKLPKLDEEQREAIWKECVDWVKRKTDYRKTRDNEIWAGARLHETQFAEESQAKKTELREYTDEMNTMEKECAEATELMREDKALWQTDYEEELAMLQEVDTYMKDIRERL
jgi:hypothetical protein